MADCILYGLSSLAIATIVLISFKVWEWCNESH